MSGIRAIFGLGNPGAQYRNTRHNIGFQFIDAVAAEYQADLKFKIRFTSDIASASIAERRVWLIKPKSFMNRSGTPLSRFNAYYGINLADAIVVHDDLDLPAGTVRLKRAGGHGGHNGLRDIITRSGSNEFIRIRIGIGRPGGSKSTTPYVLSIPNKADQSLIDSAIADSLQALPSILSGRIELAMNALHSRPQLVDSVAE